MGQWPLYMLSDLIVPCSLCHRHLLKDWRTKGSDSSPLGSLCCLRVEVEACWEVDAGKSQERAICTTLVLASTTLLAPNSSKKKLKKEGESRTHEKRVSFAGFAVFLALEWISAEPSVSQKGPGKESCDLKSFIFGISCVICGNVFKQAWEDLASFLWGLRKEKEKVVKELWGVNYFIAWTYLFFLSQMAGCQVCKQQWHYSCRMGLLLGLPHLTWSADWGGRPLANSRGPQA